MGDEEKEVPWLLPSEIPFDELKGHALEECLFWLLDGIGARDLTWRIGGTGAGAADGGRDLEARFHVPDGAGEIVPRRWWVECKGRTGTLETEAVKTSCNNVVADRSVDCLVIATNTTFTNLRHANRTDRVGDGLALRDQYIDLTQLRDDLFGLMTLLRYGGPPAAKRHSSGWTNSTGVDHDTEFRASGPN